MPHVTSFSPRYMYHVLTKNTTVTDHNRNLLVETIRSITEILIWGDQNDSSVFDFFLEKNMFAFFLNILRQKSGRYVCVQLLQTLNILFENISHETSLYYLLSNNHVNSIIVHKFDFSDEEIMAYYISFLKTLSLKMNNHTVHFFYNESGDRPRISSQVSLYLLSQQCVFQVFLIIHYAPLVNSLADVILNGDLSVFSLQAEQDVQKSCRTHDCGAVTGFVGAAVVKLRVAVLFSVSSDDAGGCWPARIHFFLSGELGPPSDVKGEEIFLDMFEDEHRSMTSKPLNVEYLMMDASILLPPTGTPLTGIDFVKRLPCGDVERTRRAIRVFFMLRSLSLHLRAEPETQLPLTREEDLIQTDDVLDLSEYIEEDRPSRGVHPE
ncbi:UNVERIFIED_CONTAM: hypothetical protein FKN15_058057 [Acipenser sinensis]